MGDGRGIMTQLEKMVWASAFGAAYAQTKGNYNDASVIANQSLRDFRRQCDDGRCHPDVVNEYWKEKEV